ncbi:hypothetical protein EV646_106381 [Kribbella antiqua]|uniref:Uncharacterized protein n=1 Tax=Kribbella antiqua TaxID=2512217 RepID=A0A4R2IPC4_9ACTN|nr:hypothetical protein [Kribbella antiqua]TCO47141.1 hypothetical protein EV646_106381 [Kribbella antiqua]
MPDRLRDNLELPLKQKKLPKARIGREPSVLLMDEPFAAVGARPSILVSGVLILSSSPTVVQEQLVIDLPAERDQLHTRADARFASLRTHVYEQIQAAKLETVSFDVQCHVFNNRGDRGDR